MGDLIDMASSRDRVKALKEARALRRAQQVALAALNDADLPALADYAKPQWPGGIDDMEF